MRNPLPLLLSALAAVAAAGSARAQDWSHTLTPYLWASGMSGGAAVGTAVGPAEADVDVSFGDILDHLKIGSMLSYRGDGERWSLLADAIFVELEAQKNSSMGTVQVDARVAARQFTLEGAVGYRISDHTLAFLGLRYNDLQSDLNITRTGPGAGASQSVGAGDSWVDPLIGVSSEIPLNSTWSIAIRGDVGGFGVGADFSWQAIVAVRMQLTPAVRIVGGYRHLAVDYNSGNGADLFKYDMETSGPALGVSFTF